eukprot:scaffold40129_cov206-Amphora_coffeaeformis.AAC.2
MLALSSLSLQQHLKLVDVHHRRQQQQQQASLQDVTVEKEYVLDDDMDEELLEETSRMSESPTSSMTNDIVKEVGRGDNFSQIIVPSEELLLEVLPLAPHVPAIPSTTTTTITNDAWQLQSNAKTRQTIRTRQALPKPSRYTTVTYKTVATSDGVVDVGGCLGQQQKRRRRRRHKKNSSRVVHKQPPPQHCTATTWQPFQEPFALSSNLGYYYTQPRLISYFEVHIVGEPPLSFSSSSCEEENDNLSLCASYIFEEEKEDDDASWTVEKVPPTRTDPRRRRIPTAPPVDITVGLSTKEFNGTFFSGNDGYSLGYHHHHGSVVWWCCGSR